MGKAKPQTFMQLHNDLLREDLRHFVFTPVNTVNLSALDNRCVLNAAYYEGEQWITSC